MNENTLEQIGFNDFYKQEAASYAQFYPARISSQHKDVYKAITQNGEIQARVSGKFAYATSSPADFPAVGDWVLIDREAAGQGDAVIHHILPRKSVFERKSAGRSNDIQIVAANIDFLFICMSVNNDFNIRRLERYLSIAWDSGSMPVIVLTKADLCEDIGDRLAKVYEAAIGVDVVTVSVEEENSYLAVKNRVGFGKSAAFIGSSGVGKSTLINALMGEEVLAVNGIREEDDKGRHTTTHRQLLIMPDGGAVIDTPGMRELQLESGDVSQSFSDIEEYAAHCRFSDCSHLKEPGCAVKEAIESGTLPSERFQNYLKLKRELAYQELKAKKREQAKAINMFGSVNAMKKVSHQLKQGNKRS
ncbi:ribosome small subunit-dependent GTPase A [Bacillus sp. 1P06AnD]|uniref:ribosome small subunit-dependent GTPase A n=1 Tax=Bacillus sp. 1P06AnD TaxID=3132208 RepID=UPI00399FD7F2